MQQRKKRQEGVLEMKQTRTFHRSRWARALPLSLPLLFGTALTWAQSGNPLQTLPRVPPASRPQVPIQIQTPQVGNQDIASVQVAVRGVNVQGSAAIAFDEVSALFTPFINGTHTVGALAQAAQKVGELYQQRGFALSFAFLPPQNFADGVVLVTVVEGYVANLQLEGDFGRSESGIRELAQPLLHEKPLTTQTFQRQTQLMARLPGVQIVASASLPTTTDGATALVIKSKHKPVVVAFGGELRKPTPRVIASLTLNDPLWAGSQLQLSTMLQKPSKERFSSLGFTQLLNAEGTLARASFSDYRSFNNPATHIPGIDDLTRQRKLDFNISHPLILSNRTQLTGTAGLYAINYNKELQTSNQYLANDERVRTLYAQLAWSSFSPQATRSANVLLARGLNAMGAQAGLLYQDPNQTLVLPSSVKLDFTRLLMEYSQRHRFASKFGAGFAVGGQYSRDILPTPEKISFGSNRFGRGYQAGEFSGDSGLGASVEGNYQFVMAHQWLKSVEPYVLYEWARTHQRTSGLAGNTLRSASLGLRLSDSRHYSLDLAASKPMGDRTANNPERELRYSLLLSYNLDL